MRLFLLQFLLLLPLVVAQTCYLPNGSPLPSTGTFFPAFAPCVAPFPSTICCATNRTRDPGGDAKDGEVKDECLPNGLCQNRRVRNGVEGIAFFANFCTDPSYPAGKCVDICPSTRGAGGNARVTPCTGKADSETWCCGESKDCCASGLNAVRLAKVLGQPLLSASSSVILAATTYSARSTLSLSSSTVLSSVSMSATAEAGGTQPSSSSQGKKSKKKGLKGGVIAGIVVGAIVVLLLVATLVVITKRRSRKRDAVRASATEGPPPQYHAAEHRVEKDSRGVVELPAPMSELPGAEVKGATGNWPHGKVAELDSQTAR